jgi:hypothetical protein
MFSAPRFLTAAARRMARWKALREEVRTERILNGLPAHIRKDIGWPEVRAGRIARRFEE